MALPSSLVGYIGLIEAAVAMFGDDNVACLRRKRAHDVGAPWVPDEDPALPPIGSCDRFAHLHLGIHPPHRRVVCTSTGGRATSTSARRDPDTCRSGIV